MKPLAQRVLDGLHEAVVAECELAAHVEERQVARDRVRGDHDPFDELMRVALDQHAVLERRRFAFVGVHDEVPRQHTFGEERPLEPGGEVRTASTAEPRLRDLLLDARRVTLGEHVAQRVVATRGECALHRPRVVGPLVQPLRDDPRFFKRGSAAVRGHVLLPTIEPEIVRAVSSPRLYCSTISAAASGSSFSWNS